jgi:hypothetical protein
VKIPPAVVGFACPAASPIMTVLPSTKFLMGPLIHTGANIFLIVENSPFSLRKLSNVSETLIPLPAIPTFPLPSLDGIIHAKNPGYFS